MDPSSVSAKIVTAIGLSSETDGIEFKNSQGGFPKEMWKTISAFSHRPGGGLIVFGIAEIRKGRGITYEAVGTTDAAEIQERIGGICNNEMSSVIRPQYFHEKINEHPVLAVYIPECSNQFKPCYYKARGMPEGAYIRDGNTNRQMTDEEMRRLIDGAKLSQFDILKAEDTKLEELSKEKVHDLLVRMGRRTGREASEQEIDFDLLRNLGIADHFSGGDFPTIAGYLIFSREKPQAKRFFNRYIIRCVRYQGSSVATDILDSLDIDGTLDDQIDLMQGFVLRNIAKSAEIVGTKREERYEYPEKALREVIANAVIHRDYKITETYTQINVFKDRIEIFNPGCLAPGVTVENIRDAQVSRNEVIAARLKDLDYLEEYGRGIDIVYGEMQKWKLLPPIFKNSTNSFKVVLPGAELSSLNQRQFAIWDYLVEYKTVTIKICEEVVLLGIPRATINYDLVKMKDMGLIHSMGESINTYYEANF